MAEKFNEFFVNITQEIVEEIHPVDQLTTSPPKIAPITSFNFSNNPLTLSEIHGQPTT